MGDPVTTQWACGAGYCSFALILCYTNSYINCDSYAKSDRYPYAYTDTYWNSDKYGDSYCNTGPW
jgi:hypothetical protein